MRQRTATFTEHKIQTCTVRVCPVVQFVCGQLTSLVLGRSQKRTAATVKGRQLEKSQLKRYGRVCGKNYELKVCVRGVLSVCV